MPEVSAAPCDDAFQTAGGACASAQWQKAGQVSTVTQTTVALLCLKHPTDLSSTVVCGFRHLDADEAVVRGAAWYAANLSTTFRLNKKFGMSDGAVYPISFRVSIPILSRS